MESNNLEALKELSKDEESFNQIKSIVRELREEKEKQKKYLELLEKAIRNDYDAIVITELDIEEPGPKIVYVNEGFCRMTGYSREEVVGKTPRILQGPKTDQKVLEKLKKQLRKGKSFFGQTVNYRKDGSEFVNQWDIHPLTDREGEITHWVSYQHDITERKRAERVLLDTKIDFDSLREEAKRTLLDVDVEGNIVMANKLFRDLTGYKKEELKEKKVWDLFPDKYRNSLKKRFDEADEKQFFNNQDFKGVIKHKSGIPIQIRGNTKLLDLKDRTLIRSEIKNVSLQKRIMDTLDKRNYDFSRIAERASEFNYQISFEGDSMKLDKISEEFPEISGLSLQSVLGKNSFSQFVHEDDLEKMNEHLKSVRNGKHSTCRYRLLTKNGDYVEVLDYCKPEFDEDKNVRSARCAVSVDVSDNNTEG